MKLKKQFSCCHCNGPVFVDSAPFCSGHLDYEDDRRTLVCTSCGHCACDRLNAWEEAGKIQEERYSLDSFGRLDWVHRDLIEE